MYLEVRRYRAGSGSFLVGMVLQVVLCHLHAEASAVEIATDFQAAGARRHSRAIQWANFSCDCPGCRAYRGACDMPVCEPGPENRFPPSTPVPEMPRQRGDEGAAGPGYLESPDGPRSPDVDAEAPLPSLAANLGNQPGALSATPGLIGDLFGAGTGSSSIVLDRVFVIGLDIDAITPGISGNQFTASELSSVVVANDFMPPTQTVDVVVPVGVVNVVPATNAEFTTVGSTAQLETALQINPDANIPIVNNVGYQGLADAELAARNGAGGATQFDAGGSFAHMQDDSLPSAGAGQGEDYDAVYAYDYVALAPSEALGGAPGANVGRQKLTENSSPIPRDRFMDSFSHFHNTPLLPAGQEVTRNIIGFEKTFFDNLTSLEFRVPYAATLSSDITLDAGGLRGETKPELGNMILYGKLLLLQNDEFALGAGLGVTLPTADDAIVRDAAGASVLRVANESPHLLPYLGFVWTPCPDVFWQGIVQLDVDTRGNPVSTSSFVNGAYTGNLVFADRLRDKDLVYVDLSLGYWLYRSRCRSRTITGIAPMFEVHYNGALDRGDRLITDTVRANASSPFDLVNAVAGCIVQFRQRANLTLAYAAPLGGDDQFDGEFRMNVNWFFGAGARRSARRNF